MIHPDTELQFINAVIGHGVIATGAIPCGTLIWVKDDLDLVVTPDTLATLPAAGRETALKYSTRDASGDLILFWDHTRFINHSCSWATLTAGVHLSIAVRDIAAGEELTEDYALLNLLPEETFACHCGSAGCRGRVGRDDVAANAGAWGRAMESALSLVAKVDQPLMPLLREKYLADAWTECRALQRAVGASPGRFGRAADGKTRNGSRARR